MKQRTLAMAAAGLFFLSLPTGVLAAAAMGGSLAVDPHAMLAAHLSALMGCFLLLGVSWTLPMLRYGERGRRWLGAAFILACYANWAVTALKSWLRVDGVSWTGEAANDAVMVALTVLVVIPFFIGGAAWFGGLAGGRAHG